MKSGRGMRRTSNGLGTSTIAPANTDETGAEKKSSTEAGRSRERGATYEWEWNTGLAGTNKHHTGRTAEIPKRVRISVGGTEIVRGREPTLRANRGGVGGAPKLPSNQKLSFALDCWGGPKNVSTKTYAYR